MTHAFPELVLGGVLVAPFVSYAAVAFVLLLVLRPLLRIAGFERVGNPPLVLLGLYVLILAALIVLV